MKALPYDATQAQASLNQLILKISPLGTLSNEAETRFQFIDELLTDCLAWEKAVIKVEHHEKGEYSDYEIGIPRVIVLEAKRDGAGFSIAVQQRAKSPVRKLKSLLDGDAELRAAMDQCLDYCHKRGVEIGIVSNGPQLIAFLASRTDGKSPLDGSALVVNGYDEMLANFSTLWQCITPAGVESRNLAALLGQGGFKTGIPRKLTSFLTAYPVVRYRNQLQDDLKNLADLILEDLASTPQVEPTFYAQCYCEPGALSQYSLLTKTILSSRYSALFSQKESATPTLVPLANKNAAPGPASNSTVMAEALANRPIVLIGDVGVGKTSFLKHMIHVTAKEEFERSIYVYVDLGSKATLEADLRLFVLAEIERQLYARYSIDIQSNSLIRGIYHGEIQRFRTSLWGDLYEKDRSQYEDKLLAHLVSKTENRPEHLKSAITHIQVGQRRPIVVMVDNSDQREFVVQQNAFLMANELARDWHVLTFISVRPKTFFSSKRAGTLSAYPPKVFTISPPRTEVMLERRLIFALNIAEGRLPVESIANLSLNLDSLSLFLKSLLTAIKRNKEIGELLANISGGNMRVTMELVAGFISTPNVDTDKIIRILHESKHYFIPLHEFSKFAILGDYAHYNAERSIALNLFDVSFPDPREHFLQSMLLSFLGHDSNHRNLDGFVFISRLIAEMQELGYLPAQTHAAVVRLTNKKLIETTERVTFEEDQEAANDSAPSVFRITSIGQYHLRRWIGSFSYLDAMAFDTPIFSDETLSALAEAPNSFSLSHRVKRTTIFRDYLTEVWSNAKLSRPYFDWHSSITVGAVSFEGPVQGLSRAQNGHSA